ncbi:hypothetical protein C8R46DRAFT_1219464 [Mycena filopes]|nr:hypothetical protein C8R46DRAFT_1219464 [Mycena filopes]
MSDPSQASGQIHSVKGTVVETVGNATGLDSWKTSGKEKHAEGEAEVKAAQTKEYAAGASDRVAGKVNEMTGKVMGDSSKEMSGKVQGTKGQAQMEANKPM